MKSKEFVYEYETEFGVFPVTDVIDSRKSKFLVKYDHSDNLLCQFCEKKTVTKVFDISCPSSQFS